MSPPTKKHRIATQHPDWVGDVPDFESHYRAVASESFPMAGPTPGTKRLGGRAPRVCAFCGDSAPSVTFRNESHAFPAGLGNRDLISNEECDGCNERYSGSDNELVRMLEPHRMVARGRRRRGEPAPKIFGDDGESYVTWSPNTGGLNVVVKDHATSTMVRVDNIKQEINLTVTRAAFRPLEAIRSLLRSAWMISDAAFRARHPELLQMITIGVQPPARYIDLSVAGNQLRVGRMVVYEKIGAVPGADVIISFTFGNLTLLFALPTAGGEYAASLLPPIEVFANPGDIGRGRMYLVENDSLRPAAPFSYSLKFENRVEGDGDEQRKAVAPNATLEVERQGERVSVRTRATVVQKTRSQTKISFRGCEFGAKLTITRRTPPSGVAAGASITEQVNFTTQLSTVSLSDARRTIHLIELMSVVGTTVRIAIDDLSPIVYSTSNARPFQMQEVSQLIDYLTIVNDELNTQLRVPAEFDDKYVDAARLLADGIRMGRVPQPEGIFSFTITDMTKAAAILPEFEKDFLTMQLTMQLRLCDPPIDPGPVTIEMVRPRIVKRNVLGSPPDEQLRVALSAEQTVYVFERWKDRNGSTRESNG